MGDDLPDTGKPAPLVNQPQGRIRVVPQCMIRGGGDEEGKKEEDDDDKPKPDINNVNEKNLKEASEEGDENPAENSTAMEDKLEQKLKNHFEKSSGKEEVEELGEKLNTNLKDDSSDDTNYCDKLFYDGSDTMMEVDSYGKGGQKTDGLSDFDPGRYARVELHNHIHCWTNVVMMIALGGWIVILILWRWYDAKCGAGKRRKSKNYNMKIYYGTLIDYYNMKIVIFASMAINKYTK
jgi:hypothetical protein